MSVELTEAHILAGQMNKELTGKTIQSYQLQNCQSLQKLGCVNKDATAFDRLIGGKIVSVASRGNTILVKLDNGWNLVLAPEYGGNIQLYKKQEETIKFHLKLEMQDTAVLTVSLTGIGCIQAVEGTSLKNNYLYRRDFSDILNPLEANFTFNHFLERLDSKKQNIKAALVGKTAVVVGVSNSAFQDIIYRAKISPKRNTGSLTEEEKKALYTAIVDLVVDRLEAGGKDNSQTYTANQACTCPKWVQTKKTELAQHAGLKSKKSVRRRTSLPLSNLPKINTEINILMSGFSINTDYPLSVLHLWVG
jgi:formamidopyrimidine-DNA glycosylase